MSQQLRSKKEVRSFFRSLCAQEAAAGFVDRQSRLNLHLREFLTSRSGTWGAYRSLGTEASVDEVFSIPELQWSFPRMINDHLEFFIPEGFQIGPFDILEPVISSTPAQTAELQGVLIPALAYNKNGHRLGKGKGFYDRTLEHYSGMKVGIAFDFQISAEPLPTDSHDVMVDYLITESGVLECRKYQE